MDNNVVLLVLAVGLFLVGLAHELGGQVGRVLNMVGIVSALVAGIAVLVR